MKNQRKQTIPGLFPYRLQFFSDSRGATLCLNQVSLQVVINQTPVPGAPLKINNDVVTADASGRIRTALATDRYHLIRSGHDGITFSPIYRTGSQLKAQSPVTIQAQRLVASASEPCLLVVGGDTRVYFTALNTAGYPVAAPLSAPLLNSLWSVTGQATPPELFASGISSFAISQSHFAQGERLFGQWNFFGQEVIVPDQPPMCEAAGASGMCKAIKNAAVRAPIGEARKVISNLVEDSYALAQSGRWKVQSGTFTVPFESRGAIALASLEKALPNSSVQLYSCKRLPKSCKRVRVQKARLLQVFLKIFAPKIPKELASLVAKTDRLTAGFRRAVSRMPATYNTCN